MLRREVNTMAHNQVQIFCAKRSEASELTLAIHFSHPSISAWI